MRAPYIEFRIQGYPVLQLSVRGLGEGEIPATKELLAFEKGIPIDEVKAFLNKQKK